jgi:hypothetical protein
LIPSRLLFKIQPIMTTPWTVVTPKIQSFYRIWEGKPETIHIIPTKDRDTYIVVLDNKDGCGEDNTHIMTHNQVLGGTRLEWDDTKGFYVP